MLESEIPHLNLLRPDSSNNPNQSFPFSPIHLPFFTPTGSRMCTLICQSITTIQTKEKGRRIIEVAEIVLDRPAASEASPSPQPQFAIEVSPESDFWDFFQAGERYELKWRAQAG
jgi:hypothetical protein